MNTVDVFVAISLVALVGCGSAFYALYLYWKESKIRSACVDFYDRLLSGERKKSRSANGELMKLARSVVGAERERQAVEKELERSRRCIVKLKKSMRRRRRIFKTSARGARRNKYSARHSREDYCDSV